MDRNSRIAVIGAGPSGLGFAMFLEQAGYTNYVIYEKEDHVGGKCISPTYNGKRYDLGAIMGVPTYYALHDVELFAGVSHDGPKLESILIDNNGKKKELYQTSFFHPFRNHHIKKIQEQVNEFGRLLMTKYEGYDVCGHRGIMEGRYEGFSVTKERKPIQGINPNLKDLALPFSEFCELNHVPLIQEFWIQPFTSFGYGYFDEIPAAYVLKYLDFRTMMNFAALRLWTWKEGTQSIFEKLNGKLNHPAVLNAEVSKARRDKDKVTLYVNGKEEQFDYLVLTCPLQVETKENPLPSFTASLDSWLDVSEQEKELFSQIDYERYTTSSFLTTKKDYPSTSLYYVDNWNPERVGHVMTVYQRWKETDSPLVSYSLRRHSKIQNGKEITMDEERGIRKADLTSSQIPPTKFLQEGQFYYFPHVSSEVYKTGWYDKVEALQGSNRTFYAGEIMSFGDMDETIEYSRDLVKRFFE